MKDTAISFIYALIAALVGWIVKMVHKPEATWSKRLTKLVIAVPVGVLVGEVSHEAFEFSVWSMCAASVVGGYASEIILDAVVKRINSVAEKTL